MDKRSETSLQGVHPDLALVLRSAHQSPQPFVIIHGLRTVAEEKAMVAKGASSTMHSRHLPGATGAACAVDFAILDGATYVPGGVLYTHAWIQIHAAALALGIPVEWGGNWKTLKDLGHVQLPWARYP